MVGNNFCLILLFKIISQRLFSVDQFLKYRLIQDLISCEFWHKNLQKRNGSKVSRLWLCSWLFTQLATHLKMNIINQYVPFSYCTQSILKLRTILISTVYLDLPEMILFQWWTLLKYLTKSQALSVDWPTFTPTDLRS